MFRTQEVDLVVIQDSYHCATPRNAVDDNVSEFSDMYGDNSISVSRHVKISCKNFTCAIR